MFEENYIFDRAPFDSCHAATLLEIEPGFILAAWFGGSYEGATNVSIWMAHYQHNQWSDIYEVARETNIPCWNPILFKQNDGQLILSYKVGASPREWTGLIKRSNDNGISWSSSEILPAGIIGPVKNKPIITDKGEWLCGSSTESWRAWSCWLDYSPDNGMSWKKFGPIIADTDAFGIIQPALFLDANKRLHMLCRSKNIGYICHAYSLDNGITWNTAKPIHLPNPNSALDLTRLQDGRIVLIYNHATQLQKSFNDDIPIQGRQSLDIALSKDDGITWHYYRNIEKGDGEYSYPSVIQTTDQSLHILYTWNRKNIKHVILSL